MILFTDRQEAGQLLGNALKEYTGLENSIILALPRGGLPIGLEIQKKLKIPMDICLVRKLGAPGQKELAIGAIAMDGAIVLNEDIINLINISKSEIEEIIKIEQKELRRRNKLFRFGRAAPIITRKSIILVDDGLATGATMKAAIKAVKAMKPKEIIVAVPVSAAETYREIEKEVDKVICLHIAKDFSSVGQWYKKFFQVSDEEVEKILKLSIRNH